MVKAKRFSFRIAAFLLCALLMAGMVSPVSAAMTELELESTYRLAADVYYVPSTRGIVIGCLEDGTELTVIGDRGSFYRIQCAEMKGYISKDQVLQDEFGNYYVNCSEDNPLTRVLQVCSAKKAQVLRSGLISRSKSYLGVRYVTNGTTPRGFDCSGFVWYIYGKLGYDINRSAIYQLSDGVIISKDDLQVGDLIFFKNTVSNGRIATHVGMYIGNGKFIHCANKGVAINSLDESYWSKHYLCSRRLILTGNASYETISNSICPINRSSGHSDRSFSVVRTRFLP